MQTEITPALLRKLLRYEPETGKLIWQPRPREMFGREREFKRWNGRYADTEASYERGEGYRGLFVLRRSLTAHRVAWAIYHGEWPAGQVDHINGAKGDNRIVNLRDVSRSENCRNARTKSSSSTGVNGVTRHGERFRAHVTIHLGIFDTIEEAAAARKQAEEALGYHPNHGRPN